MHVAGREYINGFLYKCASRGVDPATAGLLLKKATTQGSVMYAAPKRNWVQRNLVDPVSNGVRKARRGLYQADRNLGDLWARGMYRLGLGMDDNEYAAHVVNDEKRRAEYAMEKGKWHPDVVAETAGRNTVGRLYGSEYDRGDAYEHAASKQQGPMSTGLFGRALNASQPLPSELTYMGQTGMPYMAYDRELNPNAAPGVATALDYGSYVVPYLGNALFARDIAQSVSDKNYGTAAMYAGLPPALHAAKFLPRVAAKWFNRSAGAGLASMLGLGAANDVSRDVNRKKSF